MILNDTLKRFVDWFRASMESAGTTKQNAKPQTKDRPAWAVRGGKVYHLYPECPSCKRSRKTLVKTTRSNARARGLKECGMCREMIDRARRV